MNFNVDNIGANKGGNVVLLARPDGRPISLVSGQAVTAEVVNTVGSGLVMLRITPQSGNSGDTQGALLLAKTNVALNAGDQISLKVIGGDKDISLKFVGFESRAPQPQPVSSAAPESAPALPTTPEQASTTTAPATVQTVAQKVQLLLSELSGARLTSTDFQDLQKLLTNIPSNVKNQFPEFRQLASAMPDIQQLNAQTLKTAVEGSGVFLETNVKQSALQELSNAPDVVMAKDTLNSIVQKAVEAFQYPQTEEHTRSFLSDLTAVTYKGIASLNSDNARDTINMLNQAIEDCLKVVEEDKTMHTGCNCGDVLTSVKQTLDAALSPQTAPSKDAAVTLAGQLSPQRGSGNAPTDVLPSPTQKGVEAARDLTNPQVSPKDEIISLLDPGSPQRGSGNAPTDVLPLPDQKGVEAARDLTNPQVSPKDEIISLLDPGSPQRGSGNAPTDVLPLPDQKGVEAARDLTNPQVSPKDEIISLLDPGSPQRGSGNAPTDVLPLPDQKGVEAARDLTNPQVSPK
ncbi:MAG: hypothetical protein HQK97_10000, partial [Nitrospirae bacterium]|nr:hypothetical protein [Nitrospirota bacterium]